MKNLTLVIPAKHEGDSLPKVLEEIKDYDCKTIVVLERSDIETINATKNFSLDIIYQSGKGYGDALIEGINNVKTDYLCIFNADGSMDPKEIPIFYESMIKNNTDLLFASRYKKNGSSEDDTIITFIGNKIFSLIGKIFFSLPISDILYTYVMGDTKKILNLNLNKKDFRFCVELPIKAHKNGLIINDISSKEKERIGGNKKVNAFKDGFLILMEMIFLFFKRK